MEPNIVSKWKSLTKTLNEKGIPVPLIRDPKTGMGSVSLTLVFISFNVWLVSIIGKAADILGGMDNDAALQMFMVAAGLYWSRKLSISKDSSEMKEELEDLRK